jgi:hypothetical protein
MFPKLRRIEAEDFKNGGPDVASGHSDCARIIHDCSTDIKVIKFVDSAFKLRDRRIDFFNGPELSQFYRRVCTFLSHTNNLSAPSILVRKLDDVIMNRLPERSGAGARGRSAGKNKPCVFGKSSAQNGFS